MQRATSRRPAIDESSNDGLGATLTFGATRLVADRSGALYWPVQQTLVIADLHLEKGSSRAARGVMLPPYDTRETLARLTDVIQHYRPHRVIALGDSFHDGGAESRLGDADLATLGALQAGRDWVWITGNHDPQISGALGGRVASAVTLDAIRLCHIPSPASEVGPACAATAEISGHLHPAARLEVRGTTLRRPCFAGNAQRLVLPAFGAFTGGLNVLDPAFSAIFAQTVPNIWMLGRDRVYQVSPAGLRPD